MEQLVPVPLPEDVYLRLCKLQARLELESITQMVSILLHQFENILAGMPPPVPCVRCRRPLSVFCAGCNPTLHSQSSNQGMDIEELATTPVLPSSASVHTSNDKQKALMLDGDVAPYESARDDGQVDPIQAWGIKEETAVMEDGYTAGSDTTSHQVHRNIHETLNSNKESLNITVKPQPIPETLCNSREDLNLTVKPQPMPETPISISRNGLKSHPCLENLAVADSNDHAGKAVEEVAPHQHRCNECFKSFKTNSSLRRHERMVHIRKQTVDRSDGSAGNTVGEVGPHRCNECRRAFKTKAHLLQHETWMHFLFTCASCGITFLSKWKQLHHTKINEKCKSHTCSECEQKFSSECELLKHRRASENHTSYTCTLCGCRFPSESDLLSHGKLQHEKQSYVCHECECSFTSKSDLLTHKKSHTNKCEICSAVGPDPHWLSNHRYRHKTTRQRKLHKNTHQHKLKSKLALFICEICGLSVVDSWGLKEHKRTHFNERSFKCSTCGATFRCRAGLSRHQRRHSGVRNFVCTTCGRSFREREYLRTHVRTHTGEKPFVCDVCGAGFAQKGTLNSHRKTHFQPTDAVVD